MLTPATITVNFIANYAGLHRICWRVQGSSGPFVCTNLVECSGGGNACQAQVSIMVDPESCNPVSYEGYIQATCNPEGSSIDQVPWNITFTPNPVCKPFIITCNPFGEGCEEIVSPALGLDCSGAVRPSVGPLSPGAVIKVCGTSAPANLPGGYTVTESDTCCYNCTQYSVTVGPACPGCTITGSSLYYVDCATRELKRIDYTGDQPVINTLCAVTDSIYFQNTGEALVSIVVNGAC